MRKGLFTDIVLLFALCSGCVNATHESNGGVRAPEGPAMVNREIEKAAWLIGKWIHVIGDETITEVWEKHSDTVYTGYSYTMKGKDTVSYETIELQQKGAEVYYVPTVRNQNGGKPVSFRMRSMTGDKMIFENSAHDFPQEISYTRINNDSLVASIAGIVDGKRQSEDFHMGRAK